MAALSTDRMTTWLLQAADDLEQAKTMLTELDTPIGDSDHGVNMARGFAAVRDKLRAAPPADVGSLLKTVAMTLISTVGGASGPLYGTFFLQASTKATGKTSLTLAEWTECFEAGLTGLMARGKAQPGEKTMVDALAPALEALKAAAAQPLEQALAAAAAAAAQGMVATIPLQARKGRASYLGERSIGHQDPGATSSHLLLRRLAEPAG
ncbi:PTS-dependent dihydroxyacetone kinase, ADP-binding subunit DhaL [mine drainage metagenome]|uniref:PTS-dependent dihydroxyacetone kinase, ADP-binding subunit DhaL n=1 Tax=mine drainage metagenome TaxID=410659 RepID=A0A1J5RR71_9ZZZZ